MTGLLQEAVQVLLNRLHMNEDSVTQPPGHALSSKQFQLSLKEEILKRDLKSPLALILDEHRELIRDGRRLGIGYGKLCEFLKAAGIRASVASIKKYCLEAKIDEGTGLRRRATRWKKPTNKCGVNATRQEEKGLRERAPKGKVLENIEKPVSQIRTEGSRPGFRAALPGEAL
jgi:hypothetical protein